MPLPRSRNLICLVTDRHCVAPSDGQSVDRLVELVGAAAHAGVDLIQIRERDLDAGALARLVRRSVAEVAGTNAKIIVNDRVDVAIAAGAHGVHLRGDSIGAIRVRQIVPAGFVVGRSVHGVEEAVAGGRRGGLDYLIFGTLYPTPSKGGTHSIATMASLAAVCTVLTIPVLAIGGITVERAEEVARTGAAGVAAIRLFVPPAGVSVDEHLRARVSGLRRVFDTCGAVT